MPTVACLGTKQKFPPAIGVLQLALAFFLLSASGLAFEVLLTRLFSLFFQYHFAFLAGSLAILGLGIGAMIAHLMGLASDVHRAIKVLPWTILAVAISLPLSAFGLSSLPWLSSVALHAAISLIPFALIGIFSATLYAHNSQQSAFLYAADLLGAVAGLALSIALLNWVGAFNAAFVLGAVSALAAVWIGFTLRQRAASLLVIVAILIGLFLNLQAAWIDLRVQLIGASPDKTMFHILSDPQQKARLVATEWSPFARVDVIETCDPSQKYVFTDAGAGSYMLRFDGDLSQVAWLQAEIEYLPFASGSAKRTLILGAGAGKDVLQALLAGSQTITAVEINPAMVDITRKYADYNGSILDRSPVYTVVTDGRNFIERSDEQFDLIYLNLVYAQAAEPGSAALNEAYIFTTEAFRAYWRHLAPEGRLAIISHQALEGSRALLTAVGGLEAEGLAPAEVLERATLVMATHSDPNQRKSVMIMRKTPWSQADLERFMGDAVARGLQPLFVPGVFEATMAGLATGESTLDEYLVDDEYDLSPTTDDRPFFFNLDTGLPSPLATLLWVVMLFTGAYLIMALFRPRPPAITDLAYFGLLGIGFMLIETPLIQRMILLLGNPTLALSVVVGTLLLCAGIGSLLSNRCPEESLDRLVRLAGLIISALAMMTIIAEPWLTRTLLPLDLSTRILAGGLVLVPIGFSMGIPFASGLRLVGCRQPTAISLLWGWNAVTSVLGSTMAAVIAMKAGFSWAMGVGSVCYLALVALVWLGTRN